MGSTMRVRQMPGFDPSTPEIPARNRRPVTFDLRLLESFLMLADELHFGRAAERLGFAQPALSRQIRRLEMQIGVSLFTRNAHGVALTAAGLEFRGSARAALTSALDAADDAVRAAQGVSGHLTLAIGQGVLVLVGDLLRGFAEAHAKVDLEIVSITDAAGLKAVRSGAVSGAVVWSDASPPAGFETSATAVLDVPVGIRIRATHRLAAQDVVATEKLRDDRLVMFPRHAGPAQFDRIVESFGGAMRPGGIEEVALLGAARSEMMRALDDHSFTVGPLELNDDGSGGIVARRVAPANEPGRLWLVWEEPVRAPLDALVTHAQHYFERLGQPES